MNPTSYFSTPDDKRATRSDGQEARERLFLAALKLFAEQGYAKTSTREIATAAEVNISAIGVCSGYCVSGELDMDSGEWNETIEWETPPDNLEDVIIEYRENCFKYAGNVVTVYLESGSQVANAYDTENTYGAGCLSPGGIVSDGNIPIWVREVVPSGAGVVKSNLAEIGWMIE